MKPYIPQPCHEDWNTMTEKEKGRYCDACAKVVVDFTKMSDEEVMEYLQQHTHQKTCGHFKTEQLIPEEEIIIDITAIPENTPFKSLFFTSLLVVFNSLFIVSCTTHKKGKVIMKHEEAVQVSNQNKKTDYTIGGIGEIKDSQLLKKVCEMDKKKDVKSKKNIKIMTGSSYAMGMVADPPPEIDSMYKHTIIGDTIIIDPNTLEKKTMGKPKMLPGKEGP